MSPDPHIGGDIGESVAIGLFGVDAILRNTTNFYDKKSLLEDENEKIVRKFISYLAMSGKGLPPSLDFLSPAGPDSCTRGSEIGAAFSVLRLSNKQSSTFLCVAEWRLALMNVSNSPNTIFHCSSL